MKLGDPIIWFSDLDSPKGIREGTVTKVGHDGSEPTVWVDGQHKPEDCIYAAYTWPARVKEELIGILNERARLKREYDDSMKLIYELRNAITRGEH